MSETRYVLLNGLPSPPEFIDAAAHRYIGMFRPAVNPLECDTPAYVICPCGQTLKFQHELREHYLRGCCDVPQYVTLEKTP